MKEFEDKLQTEKQSLIAQKDQQFALEKLEFSKESEKKIAEQVAAAHMMAEKKAAFKLNFATNKANLATHKVELVKQAAEETPERPVKEVWEIVKDAKPVPQQQQAKSVVPASPITNKVAPVASTVSAPSSQPVTDVATNGTVTNGATETLEAKAESTETSTTEDQSNTSAGAAGANQIRSGIPQARGSFRGRAGAAAAGHAIQQANQAQGQAMRGTGIPRGGRGAPRGSGRGGSQTGIPSATNAARGGVSGSPGRGGLNAAAQQFVPGGNKRAREDGEGSHDGNQGKRPRGGGSVGGNTQS